MAEEYQIELPNPQDPNSYTFMTDVSDSLIDMWRKALGSWESMSSSTQQAIIEAGSLAASEEMPIVAVGSSDEANPSVVGGIPGVLDLPEAPKQLVVP